MKTKSLSLLIALAMCITIGGVYAAWIYAETDMSAVHGHIGSFGLANAEINNSKGTITVDASGAHLVIDQTSATDYTATLKATGIITITFAPSDIFKNSNPDLATFNMQYYLVTTNAAPTTFTCDDGTGEKALFTKFDTTIKTPLSLAKQADGKYTATLDASVLLNLIAIDSFKLDTYEKYTTFSTKLGGFGNIGIEVAEIA